MRCQLLLRVLGRRPLRDLYLYPADAESASRRPGSMFMSDRVCSFEITLAKASLTILHPVGLRGCSARNAGKNPSVGKILRSANLIGACTGRGSWRCPNDSGAARGGDSRSVLVSGRGAPHVLPIGAANRRRGIQQLLLSPRRNWRHIGSALGRDAY